MRYQDMYTCIGHSSEQHCGRGGLGCISEPGRKCYYIGEPKSKGCKLVQHHQMVDNTWMTYTRMRQTPTLMSNSTAVWWKELTVGQQWVFGKTHVAMYKSTYVYVQYISITTKRRPPHVMRRPQEGLEVRQCVYTHVCPTCHGRSGRTSLVHAFLSILGQWCERKHGGQLQLAIAVMRLPRMYGLLGPHRTSACQPRGRIYVVRQSPGLKVE